VPFDIDEELEREFAKQKEDSDNFFPVSYLPIAAYRSASLRPRYENTCDLTTWRDGCSSLFMRPSAPPAVSRALCDGVAI
jgi:hypothetical protein